ncbi:hypothetical protein [Amycolatopsis regifaucium]|uniref:hypothetical protein n=1 Tax=Amycolatopsis regifaucium TaxID=546365 RepID=UPI0008F67044|nr:hypothetical protein [Amycolatopsis regifaucium]SFI64284.1 hypothetical protein SAMN04489731_11238 [Amycolatopsis regifaucium]
MSAKAIGFPVERDSVLQLVTVIVGVIVGLTFMFGFGNVLAFGLQLGVPGWVAPLVAPAVDLSVLALLIAIRQLSLRGASAEVIRPARRLLLVSSVVTLALNVAEPLIAGEIGRALFDAVGPLLLIGWADVGPALLRELASAAPPAEQPAPSPNRRAPAVPEGSSDTWPQEIDTSPSPTKRSSLSKLDDDLIGRAIEVDRLHREEHQRPVSAEGLMRQFGLGAERSRLLMRTVRAKWEAEHLVNHDDDRACGRPSNE